MIGIFKQRFFQWWISIALVLSVALSAQANCDIPYTDVAKTHWAYGYVQVMHCKNLMKGVSQDRFAGDVPLTRFQLAKTLYTLLGNKNVGSTIYIISDILPSTSEYEVAQKVLRAGMMELDDDGNFNGLYKVKRYELAKSITHLLRIVAAQPPLPRNPKINFNDVDSSYKNIVDAFTNTWKITKGFPDNTFRGSKYLTRYESVVMLAETAALLYADVKAQVDMIPDAPTATATPTPTATKTPIVLPSLPIGTPTGKPSTDSLENLLGTPKPTVKPSAKPAPTPQPTPKPTPSKKPVVKPTVKPSTKPSAKPTPKPSGKSSTSDLENLLNNSTIAKPTPSADTSALEKLLNKKPTPSAKPSAKPTPKPTPKATPKPSVDPSKLKNIFATPTPKPSAKPVTKPSTKANTDSLEKLLGSPKPTPSKKPVVKPTPKASSKPSTKPTPKPSGKPIVAKTPAPKPSASSGKMSLDALEAELKRLSDPKALPSSKPPAIKPSVKPSIKPAGPDSLIKVPLPSAKPSVAPSGKPESPKPSTDPGAFKQGPLSNRVLLMGNYRMIYDERVPDSLKQELQMPDSEQTVSGDAGAAVFLDAYYWLEGDNSPLSKLGFNLGLSSLGGISFTSNTTSQSAELTDIVNTNLAVMYKLVASPNFDLAAGLDGYFRLTTSSEDPRNHYFLASRSYIGIGAKFQTAYRIFEPLSIELSVAPHYVIQDLPNIQLSSLPLSRFDVQVGALINWNMFKIGDNDVSLNAGYQGLLLMDLGSEGSQALHGVTFGAGYHF